MLDDSDMRLALAGMAYELNRPSISPEAFGGSRPLDLPSFL